MALVPATTAYRMTDGALSEREQDQILVERTRTGDTRAFDSLVLKYTARLHAVVYNLTANREDTCDILQETFSRAYRSLPRFRGNSSFSTWVHAIAMNATLNFFRRNGRHRTMSLEEMSTSIEQDADYREIAATSDPVREAGLNELQEQLNAALQQLPETQRAVVVMYDIQGLPHGEIARIMGISEGTVRSRLFYAHRQLQATLSEYLK